MLRNKENFQLYAKILKNWIQVMEYCYYYQAHVVPVYCWFLTATLRSFEHLCFDRTLSPEKSIFEFFVPPHAEEIFLEFMQALEQRGIISQLQKLENRLKLEQI